MDRGKGDEKDASFLILDEKGRVVLGDGRAEEIWDQIRKDEDKIKGIRQKQYASVRVGDESYLAANAKSDYNGWEYLIFASVSDLNKSMKNVLVFLAFTVISMALLDLVMIRVMSRKLYSPIDEIDSTIRKNLNVPYAGGELLDNLKELIKNNVEMNKEILINRENSKQMFLKRVYLGELPNVNREEFFSYGIELPEEPSLYYVMLIHYNTEFQSESDRQLYCFILDNIVRDLLDQRECLEPVLIHGVMYLTCIVPNSIEANGAVRIQTMVNLIFHTIKCYISFPVNIAVSDRIYELNEIPNGVWQANRALRDIIGVNGGIQFYTEQRREYVIAADGRIQQLRMDLLKGLEEGDRKQCSRSLSLYMEKLKGMKYYQMKLELYALITEILNIHMTYGITPDYEKLSDLIDFGLNRRVDSFHALEDSLRKNLMEPLFEAEESQMKQKNMIHSIIEYLNENSEKDVSLEQCAREFNYNANYLSRLFKQKLGKTYTEYVVELKVEKCKELLIQTDISVNEMAARFGYSSPQNFIRVFKKYTLMTPGQFRTQYAKRR